MIERGIKLWRRAESRLRRELGIAKRWETRSVVGREYLVQEDTFGDEADYDDAWLVACARRATSMFDVGANVGGAALLALANPAMQQVVLVEANADALVIAAANLVKNQLADRARFVGAFASDVGDSSVELWTVGVGAAGSMYRGHAVTAARANDSRRVGTVTLDELSKRFGVVPDLVKIDVEGAEAKVLDGARFFAAEHKTRFLVEMHSPPELPMEKNAELVLAWAAACGYTAWYLAQGTQLTTPTTVRHRGRCHLLLQPSGWTYPEWLVGIPQSAPLPASLST